MKHSLLVLVLALPFVGGCAPRASSQLPFVAGSSLQPAAAKSAEKAYWSLFYAGSDPQVQVAKVPLKSSSKVTDVDGTGANELVCANATRFVGTKLWIMNLSPCHGSGESIVQVYALPLTSSSTPQKVFVLSGTSFADHMAFDSSGNLWVPSYGTNEVYEYAGPFDKSGTLFPATVLKMGLNEPQGLGFDSRGNLYVANTGDSTGKKGVAVFKAPISNRSPYFLKGVISPSGLVFDKDGNLYVSSNGAPAALAEYKADHLKSGSAPSIVDSTGLPGGSYGADLNFDAAGNLYDADCGDSPGVYSYPTAKKQFSSSLAPTYYTNDEVTTIGCVWGIAVH